MNIETAQRRRILLILGLYFENDFVFVGGGVDGRNLARAVGVVERVFDLLGADAERRRLIAIDVDIKLRIPDLNIAGHVQQLRQVADFFQQHIGAGVKLVSIRPLQSQLIRTLRDLAAHLHQRRVLQIDAHAGDRCESRSQVRNNRFDILLPLRERL